MSHFTVMVIGKDIEKQLQPFHEFECTGENDEFVQDVDVTEECREHGLDWHGLEDKQIDDESKADRDGEHKFGFAVVKDGVLIKAVNRTNPNAKWDWYQTGGRWSGLLLKKDGTRADEALKSEIDISKMRDNAAEKAGDEYDRVLAVTGSLEGFKTWDKFLEEAKDENGKIGDLTAARDAYHAQPQRVALKENAESLKDLGWFIALDSFVVTREEFIQDARDCALSTFAVLKDGVWYEKGKMGWWASVSDEDVNWNSKFAELFDSLADDDHITIVDCHI